VVHYKPIATVDQNDLEFLIPGDTETYIDLDIKLFVKSRLIGADGKDLDASDFTTGTNNFLHSLFSQCSVSINGVNITPASELYPYRSYLESLMTYGSDAANSHVTNAYWYLDEWDVLARDPTSTSIKNKGFVKRWEQQKQSKVIELYDRLHAICNVEQFQLSGVRVQVRLTKAKDDFYLMNSHTDTKIRATFKFLDAELIVRRIRPSPKISVSHEALSKRCLARYNLTRVELKTFTFAGGPQAISINNAVLGMLPKRLLFTMVKNTDFLCSRDSNPYNLRHYDLTNFTMYVNGRQIPSESLSLNMDHEKTSVRGYATLFEGTGIHHSNSGLQITHDMYINGFLVILYDLTTDLAASEGHASPPTCGDIRIVLKFAKALPEAVTCLLYLEYDNSVHLDLPRNVSTDFS